MRAFFANRRFAPSYVGVILVVVGVAVFVSLGRWQLDRGDEKRALLSAYADGERDVVVVDAEPLASLRRYQRVRISGQYDVHHQVFLDNMPSAHGRAGYRVLTPFAASTGEWVLVDRGWLPPTSSRSVLPDIAVDSTPRTLEGRLDHLPEPGLRMGEPDLTHDKPWPRVLTFPEHKTLTRLLGRPIAPYIVLLDADEPDGFERQWSARLPFGPERHIAYAVQWFAFALASIVLFLIISFRRTDSHE